MDIYSSPTFEEECIVIESDDEEEKADDETEGDNVETEVTDREHTIVISDSEETTELQTYEMDNMNSPQIVENPLYCDVDLSKEEDEEKEFKNDHLVQRLKKKLLQAKSMKEAQSLETLIQKRKEKILNGLKQPEPAKSGTRDENQFRIQNSNISFRIRGTEKQNNLWIFPPNKKSEKIKDVSDFIDKECERVRAENRSKDNSEKELKESLEKMKEDLKKRRKRRPDQTFSQQRPKTTVKVAKRIIDTVLQGPSYKNKVNFFMSIISILTS